MSLRVRRPSACLAAALLALLGTSGGCSRSRPGGPARAPAGPRLRTDDVFRFRGGPPPTTARYFLVAASSRNANIAQEVLDQRWHWLRAGARPEEIACYYVAPFQDELDGDREQFVALAKDLAGCYPASMRLVRQHLRAASPSWTWSSSSRGAGGFLYLYITGHGIEPTSVRLKKSRPGDDDHDDLLREVRLPALDQYQLIMESLPDGNAGSREVRGALRAGMEPRDVLLTPAYLTELLGETAAAVPKFVVLQGCHSGAFVAGGAGAGAAGTLSSLGAITVLAAARHDRQSFGCQDGERTTYFGGLLAAVLEQHLGLPPALRWPDIHAQVARRVEALELERKEPERSLPVFFQRREPAPRPPIPRPAGWLKVQTHAHTSGSGDSRTAPADVAAWYGRRGFDALVLTDHNVITPPPAPPRGDAPAGVLVLPGVELTQNLETCTPPTQGRWRCLLHVNALLTQAAPGPVPLSPVEGEARLALLERAVAAARSAGGLVQVNHPNFHFAADRPLLEELARRTGAFSGVPAPSAPLLLEVANQSDDVQNGGDADHVDTETLWDQLLTAGARYFAVASDDAHHYDDAAEARARGEEVFVGDRGFLMVRARPDAASLRRALLEGDFYASTGVILESVERSRVALALTVAAPGAGGSGAGGHGAGGSALPAPRVRLICDGKVVEERHGWRARFALDGLHGRYARIDVVDATGQRAWVQPVFLR
jgi:hypothetical protein